MAKWLSLLGGDQSRADRAKSHRASDDDDDPRKDRANQHRRNGSRRASGQSDDDAVVDDDEDVRDHAADDDRADDEPVARSRERGSRNGVTSRREKSEPDRVRGDDRRGRGRDEPNRPKPPRGSVTGGQAVQEAKQLLVDLTGHPCESVSGLARTDDGGWKVTLEALELERVPRTTDILASYVVELDADGGLVGYDRVNRYYRNQAGTD